MTPFPMSRTEVAVLAVVIALCLGLCLFAAYLHP